MDGEGSAAELTLLFGDMTSENVTLSERDLERGYVSATMDSSDTVTVTPTVTIHGDEDILFECDSYTHTFEKTLYVDFMICLS